MADDPPPEAAPTLPEVLAHLSRIVGAKEDACAALANALFERHQSKGLVEMPLNELHDLDHLRQFLFDIARFLESLSAHAEGAPLHPQDWQSVLASVMQFDIKAAFDRPSDPDLEHADRSHAGGDLTLF